MAKPIFTIQDLDNYRIVKFEIPGSVTTPDEFATAVAEIQSQLSGAFAVLINGRGPVWGYGMIYHAAHPSLAIATYDPRLGYVVIETHHDRFTVGQILSDPEA
ncbi:CRISPR-associated ring nuclease Crn3/Csx3 [Alkalinema pantanalense CENA528]|uniref:CRISPR-associated ring nuclease Crn3/Csx3 n=1 Tax=Alkalinema pantanalense TaxID=1620705 RepID=UPI003D6FB310